MPPPHRTDVCLSVAYIGPRSKTERPRKTKIGTEVGHVTRDSDTTFKVKRSKINLQGGGGILWRPPVQFVIDAGYPRVRNKASVCQHSHAISRGGSVG